MFARIVHGNRVELDTMTAEHVEGDLFEERSGHDALHAVRALENQTDAHGRPVGAFEHHVTAVGAHEAPELLQRRSEVRIKDHDGTLRRGLQPSPPEALLDREK